MGHKLRSSLVGVGMVIVLGGCASQTAPQVAGGTSGGSAWDTSTTSPTPGSPASGSGATAKPSPARLSAADRRLEKALYHLSSQLRTVQASTGSVVGARRDVSQALSVMRAAVKRERYAAYGTSVRSCTTVDAQLAAARQAQSSVRGAHGKLATELASRAHDLEQLQKDITKVRKALEARGASTAGASAADVRAAVASAQGRVDEDLAKLKGVEAAAVKVSATTERLQVQAERIAGKAC